MEQRVAAGVDPRGAAATPALARGGPPAVPAPLRSAVRRDARARWEARALPRRTGIGRGSGAARSVERGARRRRGADQRGAATFYVAELEARVGESVERRLRGARVSRLGKNAASAAAMARRE
jgi:hypothetical protein